MSRWTPRAVLLEFAQDIYESFECSERDNEPDGYHIRLGQPWDCWHCYSLYALRTVRKASIRKKGARPLHKAAL